MLLIYQSRTKSFFTEKSVFGFINCKDIKKMENTNLFRACKRV